MKRNLRASLAKMAWNGVVAEINKTDLSIKTLKEGPKFEGGREKLLGLKIRRKRLGNRAKELKHVFRGYQRIMNSDFWEITEKEALALMIKNTNGRDHNGQLRCLHPIYVGCEGATKDERITGYLHDLMGETRMNEKDLVANYVPRRIIDALKLLHYDRGGGKTYEQYIQEIVDSGNELAMKIKIKDLLYNIERDTDPEVMKRHKLALEKFDGFVSGF